MGEALRFVSLLPLSFAYSDLSLLLIDMVLKCFLCLVGCLDWGLKMLESSNMLPEKVGTLSNLR